MVDGNLFKWSDLTRPPEPGGAVLDPVNFSITHVDDDYQARYVSESTATRPGETFSSVHARQPRLGPDEMIVPLCHYSRGRTRGLDHAEAVNASFSERPRGSEGFQVIYYDYADEPAAVDCDECKEWLHA